MIFVFDQFLVGLGMKEGMAAVSKLGGGLRHIHNFQQRPELGHHQLRTRLAHAWLQISEVFTTVTTSIRSCNATLRKCACQAVNLLSWASQFHLLLSRRLVFLPTL